MAQLLRVGGLQPFTTLDYPGQLAAVVFCQGCPWRCSYCHNPALLPARAATPLAWQELLDWLATRRGLLDAVVFSGGEPSLQRGLSQAIAAVRELGFKVGLHSAGIYPQRLQTLLSQLDWVGLDIKALPQHYPRITRVPGSGERAWRSAELLAASGIPHQLRLTWDRHLLDTEELNAIQQRLAQFTDTPLTIQHCNPQV